MDDFTGPVTEALDEWAADLGLSGPLVSLARAAALEIDAGNAEPSMLQQLRLALKDLREIDDGISSEAYDLAQRLGNADVRDAADA